MDNLPALCPPNITIHNIWINHGVSQCFLDTLSSSIMAGFILFFGTIQLIIYRKHATRVESVRLRSSMLYKLQHFLLLLMAVATMARLYVQFKYFGGIQIYGYMVNILSIFHFCSNKIPFNSLPFSDPTFSSHVLCLSIFCLSCVSRTALSVTGGACSRSRLRSLALLHYDCNRTKSRSYQYTLERLVVRNER